MLVPGTSLGFTVPLKLPGPLSDIGEIALRAAQEYGFVVNVLLLHVPLQLGSKVKLRGAEGALE